VVFTAREIADLANMVGFSVDAGDLDEDVQDVEILVAVGDHGEKIAYYNEDPNEGGMSLG